MTKKRLLIIEDDVDVSEMLMAYFQCQDYEVFLAEEGAEGINLSRSKFPNLILLDVMLPDMDGFDVCKILRTTTLTKYIPITFLTQRDARADKVAGLELGADDYVTKPFDIEELRLRVQGSIRRASRDHLHEARTGLPSGPLIQAELRNLSERTGWHYLDIHLNGLSAFREVYGFLAADGALGLTAQVMTEVVSQLGTTNDFLGTPEEGHFVIFTHTPQSEAFAQTLLERFDERVKTLYNFVDVERGYIITGVGTENERQEPFMSLKITEIQSAQPAALIGGKP
jgi:DNA-binding response OmpR family regulator